MSKFLRALGLFLMLGVFAPGILLRAQTAPSEGSPPPPQVAPPGRVRISQGFAQGLIIRKVAPTYPKEARKKHVQGVVVLRAAIDKSGNVIELSLISGDELLVPSALEAVKQWKYKPYLLNGDPVEVETQITINYTLSR